MRYWDTENTDNTVQNGETTGSLEFGHFAAFSHPCPPCFPCPTTCCLPLRLAPLYLCANRFAPYDNGLPRTPNARGPFSHAPQRFRFRRSLRGDCHAVQEW